jgi:hypothetical protein
MRVLLLAAACALTIFSTAAIAADTMPWIKVDKPGRGFVQADSDKAFRAHGFNYDRDDAGRLLEDYWVDEWSTVEQDFAEMKALGANVVRIHLQFGKFMDSANTPNSASLAQLKKLVELAERTKLYLDVTGLSCYHKADVPAWYDEMDETDRWNAQANFWKAVAGVCKDSPAIFCYDLMNEPVSPAGKGKDWLGPPLGDKHYVQRISRDSADRPRPEIAKAWIDKLVAAIREVDERHMITVGLVDWSLDRPGLTSGFVPDKCCQKLDFVCVHLYPQKGKIDEAIETLKGFDIGKPIVIEETFPMKCSFEEMTEFLDRADKTTAGVISFYWGKTPEQMKGSDKFVDAIMLQWLKIFGERAP